MTKKIQQKHSVFWKHGKHKGGQHTAMVLDRRASELQKKREALKPKMYGSPIEAVRAAAKRIGRS
ncbi:MAG: hypothetical protein A3D56_04090 [Candidatus Taylorbacteria bacterium RIFCSPHIGHO2_02_FULL_45_35]|uniref:Uncharacterized protein n=1 Tax=Candidatus Taylorbacteria bacterium RIFCSPHIGHO2_02_FULL_45_35 TaxID=1802311 RepID=A0A1G2MP49_9BACT|nr:MAG: hypothetical protein A3D56_04090 [Candidatus Taylorbacteria bacterium RIFCSPHIGHO2_02_FULL_45_35]